MSNASFTNTVANVTTLVIGLAFFAVTTVGLVTPAHALAPTAATQTVAK